MLRPILITSLLLSASVSVSAQPGSAAPYLPSPSPADDDDQPESYRSTTIAIDSVAGGLLVGGLFLMMPDQCDDIDDVPSHCTIGAVASIAGLATWVAGPAIGHASHGNRRSALISLAMRVTLPTAGFLIGAALSDDGDLDYTAPMLALGGIGGAMLVDWFILSKDGKRRPKRKRPGAHRFLSTAAPSIGPTPNGGLSLGLSGSF